MHIRWPGRVQDITVVDKQIKRLFGHGHVFIVDGVRVELSGKQGKSFLIYYNSTYASLTYTPASEIPRYRAVLKGDAQQFAGFLPFPRKGEIKYRYPLKKNYPTLDNPFISSCGTLIKALRNYNVNTRLFGVIPLEKNYRDFSEEVITTVEKDSKFSPMRIQTQGCTFELYCAKGTNLLRTRLAEVNEKKFADAEESVQYSLTTGFEYRPSAFKLSSSVQNGIDYANIMETDLMEYPEISPFFSAMKCAFTFQYYRNAETYKSGPVMVPELEVSLPYNAYTIRYGEHVFRFIIVFKEEIKNQIIDSKDAFTLVFNCTEENLAKKPGEYGGEETSSPIGFFFYPGEDNSEFTDTARFDPYPFT